MIIYVQAIVIQGAVNLPYLFLDRKGGDVMSTYEVITLLMLNGTFLITLLAYLDDRNNKRK